MSELNLDTLPKKGDSFTFKHRGAEFVMEILNARIRYGQIDVQVKPVNGNGSFWVRYESTKTSDVLKETVKEEALAY